MTSVFDIFCIIIWAIAGGVVLTNKYGVTKVDYALCWVVLMLQLVMNCF